MIQHIVQYSIVKYIIIHYIFKYSKVLFTINYNTSALLSRAEYSSTLYYITMKIQWLTSDLFCRIDCSAMHCMAVQYKVQYSVIRDNTVYLITLLYRKKYDTIHYNTFNSTQYNKYITGITRKYNTVKFSLLQPSRIQLYKFNIQTVQCSTQQYSIIRYNKLYYSSIYHRTVL